MKPSSLKHALCASISALQNSSPLVTTQASRAFLVAATKRGNKATEWLIIGH